MKEGSAGKKSRAGSSALEILMALAILAFSVSAAIVVAFGSQSVAVDTETNNEALLMAKNALENARAEARAGFSSVLSTSSNGGFYTTGLSVADATPCRKDVVSTVTWNASELRHQRVDLSTSLTDVAGVMALSGDCATEPPDGDWSNPSTAISIDLQPNGTIANDLDVSNRIIFISAKPTGSGDNFFIIDASDLSNPKIYSTSTNPISSDTLEATLNDIDVAGDYAFVANSYKTKGHGSNPDTYSNQLQVVDVSNISNPRLESSLSLDDNSIPIAQRVMSSSPTAGGGIIYYYNNKVYLGLDRTDGPELHIFDVSNPSSPSWIGSREMNHNINNIVVRDKYAYLVMTTSDDNDKELAILNIGNPANITPYFVFGVPEPWGFNASGTLDGLSEYLIGDKLYLGREGGTATEPDLLVIDVSNPTSTLSLLGSTSTMTNINAISVAGKLAFLATSASNEEFQVLDISDPENIEKVSKCDSKNTACNYSQDATGIDYEDNMVYTSNKSQDAVRIIRPSQCSDDVDNDGDGQIDVTDPQCHSDGNANNQSSYESGDNDESK